MAELEHVKQFEAAELLAQTSPQGAIAAFKVIFATDYNDERAEKVKEQAIYKLSELYAIEGETDNLLGLMKDIRPYFTTIPKSKTAKIVRTIIKMVQHSAGSVELQVCRYLHCSFVLTVNHRSPCVMSALLGARKRSGTFCASVSSAVYVLCCSNSSHFRLRLR